MTNDPEEAEHQGPHDDLRGVEEHAPFHDEVAEPGVGAHELGADDDEEGQADAETQRDHDAGQRGGQDHAADEIAPGGAEAGRRAQQHHVDAQHAGGDGHEHGKERGVADERHLGGLAEPEPHQEHRQKGQRRDRPHELDDRVDQQAQGHAEPDEQAEAQRRRRGEAEALRHPGERSQEVAD